MQQSKLITLFRGFNTDEFKRFEAFLLSPYFNQSEKLVKFFRLIEPHQPLFDSKKLEKERLYKMLHSKSAYNDATMRELISDLFKLAKTFLAHEKLRGKSMEASVLRFEWLFDRGVEKLADAELETRRLLLKDYVQHDGYYYHQRWIHDMNKFELISDKVAGAEYKLLKDFDLFAHIHSLNRDYLINCFNLHTYLISLARINGLTPDETSLPHVEALAYPYLNQGDIIIDIYFNIFRLARTHDEKYFFELKTNFLENDRSVPREVISEAGVVLENYCAKKIREGKEEFIDEVIEIYKFEVENNLCLHNNKISHMFYINIAVRCVETREHEWVEHFVETYKKYLPDEFREDSYNFAKAHVLFARKKYKEALRLSLTNNIPFLVSKILMRTLVARTQYELGMLDELHVELTALSYHLKDEKLSDERREYHQIFSTMMRQLGELKGNYNQKKLMHLSKQVEEQKGASNRKWFREKISELQNTKNKRGPAPK